jgi:hypothetical protein
MREVNTVPPMPDEQIPRGTPVTLHGYVEERDVLSGSCLVAIRPVGMGRNDPGPVQRVWVDTDEFTVAPDHPRIG